MEAGSQQSVAGYPLFVSNKISTNKKNKKN